MTKIKRITVQNLKAVSSMTADFNGCTAIITGGNNKGKSSFLRSLFDRVRGTKPDMVLKQGETEGFAEAELTSGEKLKWEFNDKGKGFKEKLTYISERDIKSSLSVELRNKFLPDTFDVDKFLQDTPAKQRARLQALVGLDFSDIDSRYKSAYEDRTAKNLRSQTLALQLGNDPGKAEAVDMGALSEKKEAERKRLNDLYVANKAANSKSRREWQEACDAIRDRHQREQDELREQIRLHNLKVDADTADYNKCYDALEVLQAHGYHGDAQTFVARMVAAIQDKKDYNATDAPVLPDEPVYTEELPDSSTLKAIEEEISFAIETNNKARLYNEYLERKALLDQWNKEATDADVLVKSIEEERMELIKSAKMPEGFGFDDDGITYNGLPFTREQLSSSGLYIAAIKLAAMTLGEIKALHFDASFLDKNSLADIEAWANGEDLQLLIERPEYQLLSNV
jgi:hypothetical protein